MSWLLEQALIAAHLMSGGAWFGALVYRTFFVDPKSRTFFRDPTAFEHFSLHQADGMRYVVAAALLVCGGSGFVLAGMAWPGPTGTWQTLMIVKSLVWLAALAVFVYISWVYWPRRVFAVESEYRHFRRKGFALALLMIAFAASGMLLGQLARVGTTAPAVHIISG